MKKMYMTPAVEINETELNQMIALSLMKGGAADDSDVLTNEESDWNIWGETEEDEE